MIPPPPFSVVSFGSLEYKRAEFLLEIKKRMFCMPHAFLKEVVG